MIDIHFVAASYSAKVLISIADKCSYFTGFTELRAAIFGRRYMVCNGGGIK